MLSIKPTLREEEDIQQYPEQSLPTSNFNLVKAKMKLKKTNGIDNGGHDFTRVKYTGKLLEQLYK